MGTVPKPDPWKCHSRLRHKIVTLEVLRSLLENAVVKVTWLLPLSTVTAPGITNIFFFLYVSSANSQEQDLTGSAVSHCSVE